MFIMDMPPESPREVPVLMAQADSGKRGDGGMQELSTELESAVVVFP